MKRKNQKIKRKEGRYLFTVTLPVSVFILLSLLFGFTGNDLKAGSKENRMSTDPHKKDKYVLSQKPVTTVNRAEHNISSGYRYDPKGRADPFKPFVAPPQLEKGLLGSGPLTPLQKFDISQLNLVGIIWGIEDSKAILEDSTGKGYIISKGTYIGKKGGVVRSIERNKIIIERKFVNYLGKIKRKIIVVNLRKLEGGKK